MMCIGIVRMLFTDTDSLLLPAGVACIWASLLLLAKQHVKNSTLMSSIWILALTSLVITARMFLRNEAVSAVLLLCLIIIDIAAAARMFRMIRHMDDE